LPPIFTPLFRPCPNIAIAFWHTQYFRLTTTTMERKRRREDEEEEDKEERRWRGKEGGHWVGGGVGVGVGVGG